ncbi:heparinase II/III family protein [Sphingomonas melonis]|uniref:heparinase II/III family protein n=1 Tax=Sphingomonas melonis TaxID=152682 RepID=UPI0009F3D5CD|nr:heparinase II/III family protein [Sphingomonas melonis]
MSAVATLDRYWQTLRHLRAEQVVGRVRHRFMPARPRLTAAMSVRQGARDASWIVRPRSMLAPDCFDFLGEARDVGSGTAWSDPATPLLWLYNLHYFDVLGSPTALERPEWIDPLIARWIAENPPGAKPAWDPYPASLRIVNWIKRDLSGSPLPPAAVDSLSQQAQWLDARIEWHLLGNHLFANAKALWFAGHFFEGREADGLLRRAISILARELDEQVPADGFHFERSPMYHAIIQEDVLDMIAITRVRPGDIAVSMRDRLIEVARRMMRALPVMTHPDGDHAFFNDAAIGISATTSELDAYASRVLGGGVTEEDGSALRVLPDAGYVRARRGEATVFFDAAPVGPDYLPGHAHADTLSLELSLGQERVIVNGGTSCYGSDAERLRQRGTTAHSTVILDGRDSSEVWSGFRVARRAHPFELTLEETGEVCAVACSHDGYRHLPGRPVHRRGWRLRDGSLLIDDQVTSARPHHAVANYLLHPDVAVERRDDATWRLRLASGRCVTLGVSVGRAELGLGYGLLVSGCGSRRVA